MDSSKASEEINRHRRRFLSAAAVTLAAAQLGMIGSANAQAGTANPIQLPTNTSFASLKQIEAGVLNVGYAEAGPADGPVVILLHGWPYDIHSYVDVAPLLASAGYGVIVPYLRGYGSTRFLSSDTIQLTREGTEPGIDHVTAEQKAAIYKGVSQVLFEVLKKPPEWTWVVFPEVEMENWGRGGMPVAEYRKRLQAGEADNERRS